MLSRYISVCFLVVVATGCASVPLPFGDDERVEAKIEASETVSFPESEEPVDDDMNDPEGTGAAANSAQIDLPALAPMPKVNSGNQALFERALNLMLEGKDQLATVLFEEVAEDQPELAGPWVNLGLIHMRAGDEDAAAAAFEKALVANPGNCDALTQMGVLARQQGRFDDAEAYYVRCIDANPGYTSARLNLGILYELYMGRYGEALAAYQDYQLALNEPDPKVGGWVLDLERRVAQLAQR